MPTVTVNSKSRLKVMRVSSILTATLIASALGACSLEFSMGGNSSAERVDSGTVASKGTHSSEFLVSDVAIKTNLTPSVRTELLSNKGVKFSDTMSLYWSNEGLNEEPRVDIEVLVVKSDDERVKKFSEAFPLKVGGVAMRTAYTNIGGTADGTGDGVVPPRTFLLEPLNAGDDIIVITSNAEVGSPELVLAETVRVLGLEYAPPAKDAVTKTEFTISPVVTGEMAALGSSSFIELPQVTYGKGWSEKFDETVPYVTTLTNESRGITLTLNYPDFDSGGSKYSELRNDWLKKSLGDMSEVKEGMWLNPSSQDLFYGSSVAKVEMGDEVQYPFFTYSIEFAKGSGNPDVAVELSKQIVDPDKVIG